MSKRNSSRYQQAIDEIGENRKQRQAFDSEGHCVVLAGSGSGKTRILTIKLARMLKEDVSAPRGIACLTYSNQCARELRKRLRLLGIVNSNNLFIGTVHSFCYRKIVIPYGALAGLELPADLPVALNSELDKLFNDSFCMIHPDESPNYKQVPFKEFRRTVLDRSSEEWISENYYRPVVEEYEKRLLELGKIDFEGMVLTALDLVQNHEWVRKAIKAKYPVLAIDEYQDLGTPLHLLVEQLCFNSNVRLFAVGDPDQSIYGFTGARPNLLNELGQASGIEKVQLDLNYRCGKKIIKASSALLQKEFDFEAASGHEGVVYDIECKQGFDSQVETIFSSIIPKVLGSGTEIGDVGILYVDKNDGQVVADAATRYGINFVRFDQGNPYPRTPLVNWLEDCAEWCSGAWKSGTVLLSDLISRWLGFNPSLSESEARQMKKNMVRFLMNSREPDIKVEQWLVTGKKEGVFDNFKQEPTFKDELDALKQLYQIVKTGGLFENFTLKIFGEQNGSPSHMNLSTVHSAKGLEYDVVIMVGLEEGRFPRTYMASESDIEESRRLFYVGVTRAKHEVHLLWSGFTLNKFGRKFHNGRSRFIDEVYTKLTD